MSGLRDYQQRAVCDLRQGYRDGHLRQMLMLATGGGKTRIASFLLEQAAKRGKRGFFIVDRLELVNQAYEAFCRQGMRVGIIQGDNPLFDPGAPVQVASVQTLARRRLPPMDFCIIDEAHVLHETHKKLMRAYTAVPFIGLSATPFAKELGKWFTRLVVGATTSELTKSGWLVPSRTYAGGIPSLEGVKVGMTGHGRDYNETQLAERMSSPKIVADVIQTWLEKGEGRQTLCFAVNIAHSQTLAAQFSRAGVRAVHIDAYTDSDERRAAIEAFKAGKVRILSSVGVLTTGFDAPNASCLILARPTKSLILHVQQLGRGLRIYPAGGKQDCLILDHAGNTLEHGFAHDPLPTELDDGKKGEAGIRQRIERPEPLPKECTECHYVKPPKVRQCPECGHTPHRPSDVETIDGELRLVDGKQVRHTKREKQRWYSELLGHAAIRGYSSGWVAHTFRSKFGVWPRGLEASVASPSEDVMAFCRHKQIAWAKRREASRG